MATFEADLQTLLGNLVSGRCYPLINTQPTIVYPYITFQKITETPWLISSDNAEAVRMQIDVFDTTYGGANALKKLVKAAVLGSSFPNSRIMAGDAYEEVPKKYRAILEYYFWLQ